MKNLNLVTRLNSIRFIGFSMIIWLLNSQVSGALIRHFNLTKGVADWVIGAIASGGAYLVLVYYPLIAPVVITLKGKIAVLGVSFAVVW